MQPPPPVRRWSAGAIIAFVLAVIPLCPPINFLGAALGMIAMRRIDAGLPLRGRGLARSAAWLGLGVGLVSWWALGAASTWMTDKVNAQVHGQTVAFFDALRDGDLAAAQGFFVEADRPDAHDLQALRTALEHAGGLSRVQVHQSKQGDAFGNEMTAWLVLEVGDKQLNGGVRVRIDMAGMQVLQVKAALRHVWVGLSKDHRIDLPHKDDDS